MKIAITGTTSEIDKAFNALSSKHEIVCLDQKEFDLSKIEDFYKTRSHINVEEVAEVIKFVIDNNIVNQITIEK
jgi:dTDP-4-dehydrorhamnose reductase